MKSLFAVVLKPEDMTLLLTLLPIFIVPTLVFGHLHSAILTTGGPRTADPWEERHALTKDRGRQHRSGPISVEILKVFDFSADNDNKPDSNGEYTGATLEAGPLPESFTICSAFMVEAWTTDFSSARMFTLLTKKGAPWWGYISVHAAPSHTGYKIKLGPVKILQKIEAIFFPLQWTHVCLSLDSVASKVTLVVDGQLLGEEEYKKRRTINKSSSV